MTMAIGIMPFAALSVGAVGSAAGASSVSEAGMIKFAVGNELVAAHSTANGCTVDAPEATVDSMFGWYGVVENGNATETMLIERGETVVFEQGDTAVFKPLTLDIRQVSDPLLRMKDDEIAGLRFLSNVSKTGYRNLLNMIASGALANAQLSFGTSFETPNGEKLNVPVHMMLNAAGDPIWYQENEELGCIAGTIWTSDIESMLEGSDIALNTAGIIATGYAKLTFGGKDYYAYAKNNDKKASTIYESAIEALNKVSPVQNSDHKLQVGKNLYSPYSVSEREALRSFVDNVVSMKTADSGDTIELIQYTRYNPNSKWKITEVSPDDADWSVLLEQLGNPSDVVLICKLEAKDVSASDAGGILLDGVLFEGTAIEEAGSKYYLIEFVEYIPNN